jgi:hypothetical protein
MSEQYDMVRDGWECNRMVDPEPMPVTVLFRPGIRSDGEIVSVAIRQGSNEILLTGKQTAALVAQIIDRSRR